MTAEHAFIWKDGQPYSSLYQDVYFSRDSGLEETRHVFLAQNHLHARWQALKDHHFTICETGFGTGLNFLCAWQLWKVAAPDNACLHFVSTEKFPLQHDDLAKALNLWPELSSLSNQLLAQYQMLAPGWHKLIFEQGRITLTLLIGDARDTLPQLKAHVDAWFLDGFAPAKNPEMWQQDLFDSMAKLSHSETTFATFTSAGIVRRVLQAAGFEVRKLTGFGSKREMLAGKFSTSKRLQLVANRKAVVIGGGIAGTSSAHALAVRGWQVTIIERHEELAQEASGNPVAVLYPRLTGQDIVLGRLAQHGFLHTSRMLQQLELGTDEYAACGLLQLAFDARELTRCQAVAARGLPEELVRLVDADEASRIAGIQLAHGGLFLPSAGWVNPTIFCKKLGAHPNINILTSASALHLEQRDQQWLVWDENRLLADGTVVIVASANQTGNFVQTAHLPLEPVRGQITCLAATGESLPLKTVVCTDGYISPAVLGRHCIGATFSDDTDLDIRQSDHASNLAMLKQLSPELHEHLKGQSLQGRAALRAVTPDYLPMAGPLLDADVINNKPPRYNVDPATLPWLDGLYVNTGHGSKGLINAPLCAEMLACAINGEPAPVDGRLLAALDPNRFLLRKFGLKRLVQGLAAFPYSKITR